MKGKISQVNVGSGGVPKSPVSQAYVSLERLLGDQWSWGVDQIQDNGKPGKHGGSRQAVCLYSVECLAELNNQGFKVFPGALGENLTTEGIDYREVRIGDVYQVGADVQLRLTKIRTPCATIAEVYGTNIIKAMIDERVQKCDYTAPKWGMTGFYAEVFQAGRVRQHDTIERIFEGDVDIPLGKWREYTGKEYDLVDIALDAGTNPPESIIVYRARGDSELGPRHLLVMSKNIFLEKVRIDGVEVPRFTFID